MPVSQQALNKIVFAVNTLNKAIIITIVVMVIIIAQCRPTRITEYGLNEVTKVWGRL